MEINQLDVILAVSGLLVGWGITHIYYKKSSAQQQRLFDKLPKEIRDVVLADARARLTVTDLNELIRERTIDREGGETLPYTACPRCGSEDLRFSDEVIVDDDGKGLVSGYPYSTVQCRNCQWYRDTLDQESPRDEI